MKTVRVIFARELEAYFDSAIAYIFAVVFLVLTCGIFMNEFFLTSVAEMDAYFGLLPLMMILFLPAVSMRLWAEDRKDNTYELLMTLPVRRIHVILGKYAASFLFFLVTLAGTLPIAVMLVILGEPDLGKIAASYLGAFFLGGLYIAVGMFLSGLTRDQIVAYLLGVLATSLFHVTGHEKVAGVLAGLWPWLSAGSCLRAVGSALPRYASCARGVVDLRDGVYFLVLTGFFVWLNDVSLERDRR